MRRILLILLALFSTSTMASDKLNLSVNLTTECAIDTIAPIAFADRQWLGDFTIIFLPADVRIDCPFDTPYSVSFSGGAGWDPALRSRFLTLDGAGGTQYRIPYEIRQNSSGHYLLPHSLGTVANYYGATGNQFASTFSNASMTSVLSIEFRIRGTSTSQGTLPRATQFQYIPGTYRDRINLELVF